MALPVAVDAMGGDNAPGAVIDGARQAADNGIPVLLVGRPEELGDAAGLDILAASEVIAMDAEPGAAVRRLKDSSLVRAAEAVRDGKACAMVSAGNTGATMASALFRMGRLKGVSRPAIATALPIPGDDKPNILLDAGANAECQAEWLVQFGILGAVHARDRFGVVTPRVGLLSIGEEAGKGTPLVKQTFELMSQPGWQAQAGCEFVGNVEGRDIFDPAIDVIVTDGFTGNVALKTAEGVAKSIVGALMEAFDASPEARQGAELLMPALAPMYARFDPENTGGAMLLGVDGVCIISHGSSSAHAVTRAIEVAHELDAVGAVSHLKEALV